MKETSKIKKKKKKTVEPSPAGRYCGFPWPSPPFEIISASYSLPIPCLPSFHCQTSSHPHQFDLA